MRRFYQLRRLERSAFPIGRVVPAREEADMGTEVIDMSMSLDGYIAAPNDNPEQGLGEDGMRLHNWRSTIPRSSSGCMATWSPRAAP
jgi:hypothetical protein